MKWLKLELSISLSKGLGPDCDPVLRVSEKNKHSLPSLGATPAALTRLLCPELLLQ